MNTEMYKEAIEYELLTQAVYQGFLERGGGKHIDVQHNVNVIGRSGVEHQVDVYWESVQAGVTQRVLVECKNYSSSLTLEKVRNFFAVIHDVGNCVGVMVTKRGYQSGAAAFGKHYGILLKRVRQATEDDWRGRVRKIGINITPRVPVSTEECPIACELAVRPNSEEQQVRMKQTLTANVNAFGTSPSMVFLNGSGEPCTDELRWWLPRQLDVLNYKDGGPYEKSVELIDCYLSADLGAGTELVQVTGVSITFYVETLESAEILVDAADIVATVLEDFESGELEHFQTKNEAG